MSSDKEAQNDNNEPREPSGPSGQGELACTTDEVVARAGMNKPLICAATEAALADTFRGLVLEVDPEKDRQVEDGRWALDASFCFQALGRLRCRANERFVHACVVSCRNGVRRQRMREERTSSCYPKGPKFFMIVLS